MPPRIVRIRLPQRAIDAARRPRRAAASALHPQARVILGEATPAPADTATCIVTCTIPEARALLDHFDGLCESLAGLGDPDAVLCADARDTIRRAIVASGA